MHFLTLGVFERLLPHDQLVVFDCGASAGGEQARWRFLGKHVRIHAFEADAAECRRLEEAARAEGLDMHYWPIFLGRTQSGRTLNIGVDRFNVSFLRPNSDLLDRMKDVSGGTIRRSSEGQRIVDEKKVDTVSLDDWAAKNGIEDVDFIKDDIEGLELELLEASPRMTSRALGTFIDVVFTECWHATPRVAETEMLMQRLGFALIDICRLKRAGRFASPYTAPGGSADRPGQATNADFLYLRDPIAPGAPAMDFAKALKLTCIAEVMGQVEYAFEILVWLRDREADAARRAALGALIDEGASYYARRDRPWMRRITALREIVAHGLPRPVVALLRPIDRLFALR